MRSTDESGRASALPLAPSSVADNLVRELELLLRSGRFAPGSRFESERTLGERYAVSRTVVREAVHRLVARGLLRVRGGSGTFVSAPDPAHAARALSLLLDPATGDPARLYEVRRPIEIEIAGLAAARANAEDLARLETLARVLEQPHTETDALVEADVAFHMALAQATHNPCFPALLGSFNDLLQALRRLHARHARNRSNVRDMHRAIADRVAAHDVPGAKTAMARHMDAAQRVLKKVTASAQPGRTRSHGQG